MKRIIIFLIFILNLSAAYSQLVCFNFDTWYGHTDPFSKDSIVAYVNLERHNKNILFMYIKKLPGYKLQFKVEDKYCVYSEIDSIVFNIYSATSESILQSTLSECSKFIIPYNMNYADAYMSKVYMHDSLKRHRENLLIDFTLYLRTKSNEQRQLTISRYELKYERGNGIYRWPI